MLRAEETEKDMVIYIQDTGLGIPDESLPHLFQKFFRVREHEFLALLGQGWDFPFANRSFTVTAGALR